MVIYVPESGYEKRNTVHGLRDLNFDVSSLVTRHLPLIF